MHATLRTTAIAIAAATALGATAAMAQQAGGRQQAGQRQQPGQRQQMRQEHLTRYFADKLMLANKAEIEMSQLALEHSDNEQVKQLAQTLIEDHKQLNDKLKELSPEAAEQFAALDGRQRGSEETRTGARHGAGHNVLTKLCMINHRAAQNQLESSKQMLKNYQGQDFTMAFLGLQIGQHSWLLSELKALDGVGSEQFQEVVTMARQKVANHLEKAKSLSKKFEDQERAS